MDGRKKFEIVKFGFFRAFILGTRTPLVNIFFFYEFLIKFFKEKNVL